MSLHDSLRACGLWHPVSKRTRTLFPLLTGYCFFLVGTGAGIAYGCPPSGPTTACTNSAPEKTVDCHGSRLFMLAQALTPLQTASKDKPAVSRKDTSNKETAKRSDTTGGKASNALVSAHPKVIEVSAVWCVPCKKFAPIFQKVKAAYGTKVDFQSLDFDSPAAKSIIEKFGVASVPTIVMVNATGKPTKFEDSSILNESKFTAEVNKLIGK